MPDFRNSAAPVPIRTSDSSHQNNPFSPPNSQEDKPIIVNNNNDYNHSSTVLPFPLPLLQVDKKVTFSDAADSVAYVPGAANRKCPSQNSTSYQIGRDNNSSSSSSGSTGAGGRRASSSSSKRGEKFYCWSHNSTNCQHLNPSGVSNMSSTAMNEELLMASASIDSMHLSDDRNLAHRLVS